MQWSTFALLSVGKLLKSGSATSEQQTSGVHIMALIININVQSKRLSLGFYRNRRRIKKVSPTPIAGPYLASGG